MNWFVLLTLAGSLAAPANAPRDPSPAKGEDKAPLPADANARPVEVRFANGSTVLMVILQDNIEMVTEFGKLKIPPAEIRHIEFGLHLTEPVRAQIDRALQQLS